jgi:hypothetical protein
VIEIAGSPQRTLYPFYVPPWMAFALILVVSSQPDMAQSPSPSSKRDINAVLAAHDKELLALPDVVGVYVGTLEDNRTPCLKVMLSKENPETKRRIPRSIEDYPLRVEVSGPIRPMGRPSE